ncbi:hypothetical protein Tco_1042661 [Tanacetum coccineum]|uniref:Uncharacterized protein n=1 Tax=Tanacetum coccineum TaxID=301880 RepID=A0ABQ5GJZ7_9ASTR
MRIRLTSVEQETMSLRGISETLEQHDEATYLQDSQNEDIMHLQRAEILGQDVEALHARAEAAKQRVEALQASFRAPQMDIVDLQEPRRGNRIEMAELWSQAQDIEAQTKIRMAHDSMDHVIHQGTAVAKNANNKRKWGSDHRRFKSDCPKLKNQNRVNQIWKGKAHVNSNVVKDNADA